MSTLVTDEGGMENEYSPVRRKNNTFSKEEAENARILFI